MDKNKSSNKVIIGLLIALIVAVLCVGGYFVIKDITKNQDAESSQSSDDSGKKDSNKNNSQDDTSNVTPTPEPAPAEDEIEAAIIYSEIRGNDYYIEAQTNGAISGTCEISMVPTNGGQGHHETDDLDVQNKVSTCDEDFSLKGLSRGEHKITVVIRAYDGRTKTLEQIVNL